MRKQSTLVHGLPACAGMTLQEWSASAMNIIHRRSAPNLISSFLRKQESPYFKHEQ